MEQQMADGEKVSNLAALLVPIGPSPAAAPSQDTAIFVEIYPLLRAFAAIVADLDVDPDDLVQDALVATLTRNKLEELDQPAAYLKRAILNRASNGRRSAGRFRKLLPKVARDSSIDDHYPSDLAILDELTPLDRAVIYLADVEGIPLSEIAVELEMKPATVRKRASRGREQLRKSLEATTKPVLGGTS